MTKPGCGGVAEGGDAGELRAGLAFLPFHPWGLAILIGLYATAAEGEPLNRVA